MQAAGANQSTVNELKQACDAFTPFANHTVKGFAEFLARAAEFDRTGTIPVTPAKPTKAPAKAKAPAMTLADAKAFVDSLYERAILENLSSDQIKAEVQTLFPLSADLLKSLARDFCNVPGKNKQGSLDEIIKKILNRTEARFRSTAGMGHGNPS